MSVGLRVLVLSCSVVLLNGQWNVPQINQLWGANPVRTSWGNQNNVGWWNGFMGANRPPPAEFRTCIGRNNMGDEIRVSFTNEESNNLNNWAFNWNRRQTLRFKALIFSRSQLQGQFAFVVTEYGRVEDSCISRALGNVLGNSQWWNQNRIRGIIGTPVTIMQGQTSSSSAEVDDFTLNELNGRGFALCASTRLSGTTCLDLIPLCCKIGRDTQDVTLSFGAGQMQFGSPGGAGVMGPVVGGPIGQNGGSDFNNFPPLVMGATTQGDEITKEETPSVQTQAGSGGLGLLTFS